MMSFMLLPFIVFSTAIAGPRVHLTIDDLPYQVERTTPMPLDAEQATAFNDRLIQTLGMRAVKASVFFNCVRLQDGDEIVEKWNKGGHAVGNHSHTHVPLNEVGPEEFLGDVTTCHEILTARLDEPPTLFRYPYLGHGDGKEARDNAKKGLQDIGYRNVPVTIATTEWMYGYAYRRAKNTPDAVQMARVVTDFHRHMDEALENGQKLAAETPGNEVTHIVLVHMNELVVDHIADVIDRWQSNGVEFVDVQTAMADPVYAMENKYDGKGGISWLMRIRPEGDRGDYWFGEEEARVVEKFGPMPVKGEE